MRLAAGDDGVAALIDERALPLAPSLVEFDDGVLVWVDPLDLSGPWRIELIEPDAIPVVEQLVGSDAAERVRTAYWALVRGESVEPVEVPVVLGAAWPDVARLGFLLWLEQHAIAPLAASDLDLEVAILAARLAPLGTGTVSRARFVSAAPRLRRLAVEVRDGADIPPVGDAVVEGIDSYLRDAAAALPDPVILELQGLADAARSATGSQPMTLSDHDLNDLLDSFQRSLAVTRAAGASASTFSVDWEQVARGMLDPGEDTVQTEWDAGDGTLAVTVLGAPGATRVRNLVFRVQRAADAQPSAVGALEFDAAVHGYRGSCPLTAPLMAGDRVDVATVGWRTGVAVGDAATLRRARRSAAWAVGFERQGIAAGGVQPGALGAAQQAWFDAADRFGALDRGAADRCIDRAREIGALDTPEAGAAWVALLPTATIAERMLAHERRADRNDSIAR